MKINPEFIKSELYKKTTPVRAGSSLMIQCPFHEDKDPSLGVSLGGKVNLGVWNCLGCKQSGTWNMLAEKIGLKTLDYISDNEQFYLSENIELFKKIDEDSLTLENIDFIWRSYSPIFLSKFNAKKLWHDTYKSYYLYFPIYYAFERLGFARLKINDNSIGPKTWFNIETKVLYPFDYIFGQDINVLVLVEGIADCLRLLKFNIPALAILGSYPSILFEENIEMIDPDYIIIMLDGDLAGKRAVEGYKKKNGTYQLGLKSILNNLGYNVIIKYPPKGKDPDDMSIKHIIKLLELFKKLNGKLLIQNV